jgi:hypothetical protein
MKRKWQYLWKKSLESVHGLNKRADVVPLLNGIELHTLLPGLGIHDVATEVIDKAVQDPQNSF